MNRPIPDYNSPAYSNKPTALPAPGPLVLMGRNGHVARIVTDTVYDPDLPTAFCWGAATLATGIDAFGSPVIAPNISGPTPLPLGPAVSVTPITTADILAYGDGAGGFAYMIDSNGAWWYGGDNIRRCSADPGRPYTDIIDPWEQTATVPFDPAKLYLISSGDDGVAFLLRNGDVWGLGGSAVGGSGFTGLGPVGDLTFFTQYHSDCIDVDTLDSCGLVIERSGRLKCTGKNWNGRFAVGEAVDSTNIWVPVPAGDWQTGGGFYKARFMRHATPNDLGGMIALKRDGSLWFVGSNIHFQSGQTSPPDNYEPHNFVRVPNIPPIVDFALNDAAVYALDEAGNVWTWGVFNSDSNISGAATGQGTGTHPTPAIIATGAVAVAATANTGFALKADGFLYAWGAPSFNGTGRNSIVPTPQRQGVLTPASLGIEPLLIGGGSALILTSSG